MGPQGWGPKGGWGPAQNFALFFPFPPQFIRFSLSFGLFRGILVVFVFEAPLLLEHIPAVQDLQSALLFCAGTRANCLLRTIPPHLALEFEANHTRVSAILRNESWVPRSLRNRGKSLSSRCHLVDWASGVGQG